MVPLAGAGLLALAWSLGLARRQSSGGSRGRAGLVVRELWLTAAALVLVPLLVYLLSYSVWFMEHDFDVAAFVDLHQRVASYHLGLDVTHTYESKAWTWPLVLRPVAYYWRAEPEADESLETRAFTRRELEQRAAAIVDTLGSCGANLAVTTGQQAVEAAMEPLVARGGDHFVIRSFSPVTTIGGGLVLDPFPPKRPRVSERGVRLDQPPAERLARFVEEAGLGGLRVTDIPVRLGIRPSEIAQTIEAAGKPFDAVCDFAAQRLGNQPGMLVAFTRRQIESNALPPASKTRTWAAC